MVWGFRMPMTWERRSSRIPRGGATGEGSDVLEWEVLEWEVLEWDVPGSAGLGWHAHRVEP